MTTEEIKQLVVDYASACGLRADIAYLQIQRESSFNPNARGADGEKGIAQFTPGTWARFGQGAHDNAFQPSFAMNAYCRYMQHLLGLFGGDYEKALIGYNGGEGHLTDPGKHGPPSARALAYGRELMAQAGSGQADNFIGTYLVTGGERGQGFPTWLVLGFAALLVWVIVSE
jgi:soluble lytic murein transglycosylase-like protein